jgi:hypothetical protein
LSSVVSRFVVDTRESQTTDPPDRTPDLRLLGDRYDVVGELRRSATTRYFFGRRRADAGDVLIAVVAGDIASMNNALGHLASDAQLLEAHAHATVAKVIEGRWLGSDRYAVITERVAGETLYELLSADGPVAKPRIAFLLQEVHSALAWARGIGVVHRGVTPEAMYIDPESRRPRVVLSLTPIELQGLPDAAADARTIGRLAWGMLAGRPYADDAPPLHELQPELSSRVVEQTTMMVQLASGGDAPDVERFLATIAMGDALRDGEMEMARLRAEHFEQRRIELAQNEARERELEARMAALERQLAEDREQFESIREAEEARLENIAQQLAAERAQFEQEHLEFADRVAEFELRASIERPGDPATPLPPLESERVEAALIGSGSRFGWILPVATVALLIAMIVFGSVFARHRPSSQTLNYGRPRGSATVDVPQAILPRGGFLTQSPGSIGARIPSNQTTDSSSARGADSIARRDSRARRDSLARRDSIARDSVMRRDTIPRSDTLVPPDTGKR